jgi:hypothetical protein
LPLPALNATNGEVASFTVGNDGSLTGTITATIDDEQIVTLTDPQGRVTTFTRGMYRAPDGTTAVNTAGGVIEHESGIEVRVPDAALDHGLKLTLEAFPTLPTLPGAQFGQGLKVSASEATHFKKEVDLAFPIPAGAPTNPKEAFYHVYRRCRGRPGRCCSSRSTMRLWKGRGRPRRS